MPELPEVEIIRRDLEREVVGKKIKAVQITGARSVRRHPRRAHHARSSAASSRRSSGGASTCVWCSTGDVLVVHLRHVGPAPAGPRPRTPKPKHTHVVITFTQGGQLRFVDPRTFGEMFVTEPDQLARRSPELADLGLDPLETALSWEDFGQPCSRGATRS